MTRASKVISPAKNSAKNDHAAFALLIAVGLAVAVVTGASLSGIAGGVVVNILRSVGFGQGTEIQAEQRRQAVALAKLETSLGLVRGEVASLHARTETHALANTVQSARPPDGGFGSGGVASWGQRATELPIEIAALRSSLDEHDQRNRQEFIAVNKRIDWLENLVYGRDTTGSVQPSATPPRRHVAKAAPRWFVLHAQNGVAVIAGKSGAIDVTPGLVVPELGRVSAVEQRDGRWVVVTDKGTIREK